MSVRVSLRGSNMGPNGFAVVNDGDEIAADHYGNLTVIRRPRIVLPTAKHAVIGFRAVSEYTGNLGIPKVVVRQGRNAWAVSGESVYIDDAELVKRLQACIAAGGRWKTLNPQES